MARTVYAGARDPSTITDPGVVPVRLDVAAAAERCGDATLLVNNAGISHDSSLLAASTLDVARAEMETNYFGTLSMVRAFAPVLARNGGGAIVNMPLVLSFVHLPQIGSSRSRAATLGACQPCSFVLSACLITAYRDGPAPGDAQEGGTAGAGQDHPYTRYLAAVVFIEQAQRRTPVQYAKRTVGRRMYGATSTYLPLRVNQAGIVPVIFTSSLLFLPQLAMQLTGGSEQRRCGRRERTARAAVRRRVLGRHPPSQQARVA